MGRVEIVVYYMGESVGYCAWKAGASLEDHKYVARGFADKAWWDWYQQHLLDDIDIQRHFEQFETSYNATKSE